jgi:hypothetical protein
MLDTKQQVFEYFVDQTIRIATPLGMSMARSTQFRNDALEMYAGATDETPEQAKCPYCHEPHRVIPTDNEFGWGGESDNFLRIGMTGGDGWNGIPPKLTPSGAIHTVMPLGYDNAEVDETISINYCPMCGRRLEASHEPA